MASNIQTNTGSSATPQELANATRQEQIKAVTDKLSQVNAQNNMSVDQLKTTPVPTITTPPAMVPTNVNANATLTQAEQALQAEQERARQAGATSQANIVKEAGQMPTSDLTSAVADFRTQYGVGEAQQQVANQSIKVAETKKALEEVNALEQAEIENLNNRMISEDFKESEIRFIQNKYNIQRAKANANLSAEAALLAAYQGNYNMAKENMDDAIKYYTYEQEQKVKRFETLLSVKSDWVKSLDAKERDMLDRKYQESRDNLALERANKQQIADIMTDPRFIGSGIKLTDSLEEAVVKAAKYQAKEDTRQAQVKMVQDRLKEIYKSPEVVTETDDRGNVVGINKITGEKLWTIPGAGKTKSDNGLGMLRSALVSNQVGTMLSSKTGQDNKVSWETYLSGYQQFSKSGGGTLQDYYLQFPPNVLMDTGNREAFNKQLVESGVVKEEKSGGKFNFVRK